jgi:hypothetical protein
LLFSRQQNLLYRKTGGRVYSGKEKTLQAGAYDFSELFKFPYSLFVISDNVAVQFGSAL